MKRKIGIIFTLLLIVCVCLTISACNRESAALSCEGATADGFDIFLEVGSDVESVDLSSKIHTALGVSWEIFSDESYGLNPNVSVKEGENVFYIATKFNGVPLKNYTLRIFRAYNVNVNYYADGVLVASVKTPVNGDYTVYADVVLQKSGYTFDYWTDENGVKITSFTALHDVDLYAKFKRNFYTLTLDANGGAAESAQKQVEYDNYFTLPIPTREGYSFAGWYIDDVKIADAAGWSVEAWQTPADKTLLAQWRINSYSVTASANDDEYGTVAGGGKYQYNSNVTLTATSKAGYTWLGWYDKDVKVSSDLVYTFTMPSHDAAYTARWVAYTYTVARQIKDEEETVVNTVNCLIGNQATVERSLKQPDVNANVTTCYVFTGWYDGDTLLTENDSYTFTMTENSPKLVERYLKLTFTSNDENTTQTVSNLQPRIGDTITISTSHANKAYTFLAWYGKDPLSLASKEQEFTYTVQERNAIFEATWEGYKVDTLIDGCATSFEIRYGNVVSNSYSQIVPVGAQVTVTVSPFLHNCLWEGWYQYDTLLTTETSYTFTMSAINVILTGKSTYYSYQFGHNSIPEAKIQHNDYKFCKAGDELPFTVTDYSNDYVFLGWYIKNKLITTDKTITLPAQKEMPTPMAEFVQIPQQLDSFEIETSAKSCVVTGLKTDITEVTVDNCVSGIANEAFKDNAQITSLTINASVRSIGDNVFANCTNLTQITYNGTVECWNKIQLSDNWNASSNLTQVICSDGVVQL